MSSFRQVDPDSSDLPALRPRMRAVRGFTVVLLRELADIDHHWQGTVTGDDPEALHDLRIAVRRTRCLVREGRRVLPDSVVHTARTEFRDLADLTGPPRDLDVLVATWPTYTTWLGAREAAAIERVGTLIDNQRSAARRELAAGLDAGPRRRVDAWRECLDDVGSPAAAADARQRLGPVVERRVRRRHAQFVEHGRLIGQSSPDVLLHDVRKDAKNLRYLIECFEELLAPEPRKVVVARLKAVQEVLGNHQDAVAHHAVITAAAVAEQRPSAATRSAVATLLHELDRRRDEHRTAFAEQFDEFDAKTTRAALRRAVRDLDR